MAAGASRVALGSLPAVAARHHSGQHNKTYTTMCLAAGQFCTWNCWNSIKNGKDRALLREACFVSTLVKSWNRLL